MKKIFFSTALVISFCIISCTPDSSKKTSDTKTSTSSFDKQWAKSFIDSIDSKFLEQFRAGDSVALASHYWSDAEILLANSEALKGNGIRSGWGFLIHTVKDFTFSATDIVGDTEFLIETGNYEMKDEKKTLIDKGKYVLVWQQRNGEWRVYRDIANTSLPASK